MKKNEFHTFLHIFYAFSIIGFALAEAFKGILENRGHPVWSWIVFVSVITGSLLLRDLFLDDDLKDIENLLD